MEIILKRIFMLFFLFLVISFFPQDVKAIETNELSDLDITLTSDGVPYISQYNVSGADLQKKTWNNFFDRYRGILLGLSGVCSLTFIALFILNITKLGQSVGNPQKRTEITIGLLWTGIGAAGFSTTTIFMAMAYKSFK